MANKCILTGNVVRDNDVKDTGTKGATLNIPFSLAERVYFVPFITNEFSLPLTDTIASPLPI